MSKIPAKIYKYESPSIQYLINLKAQSLYFSSPRNFNDAYDCATIPKNSEPTTKDLLLLKNRCLALTDCDSKERTELESISLEKFKRIYFKKINEEIPKAFNDYQDSIGICCFSECYYDLLMWGHYGGKFKGFCLEFDTQQDPFSELKKVKYLEKIPEFDAVNFEFTKDHNNDSFTDLFYIKNLSWNYEEEYRIIHVKVNSIYTYKANALTAVYFGPEIETQLLEIVCMILLDQNSEVKFYKGERNSSQFRINFKPFKYTP